MKESTNVWKGGLAVRLEGRLVTLRPLEVSDSKRIVSMINREELKEFLMLVFPITEYLEEEWIKRNAVSHNSIVFGLECESALVGTAGLTGIDWVNRSAEYGIGIYDPKFWNRGIGTEATSLVLKYAFEYLNLNRVWLRVLEYNRRAIRVYEKCGFIQEGRERQGRYYRGHYWDLVRMSILAEEYWRHLNGSQQQR